MKIYFFALLAMLFWGTAPILGKLGLSKVSPLVGLSIRTFAIALILLIYGLLSGEIIKIIDIDKKDILLLVGEGILASLLGHLAYFFALKYGEASKVVPFIAAYPLVTLVIGLLILNEGFSWQKIAGSVLIALGILLLK